MNEKMKVLELVAEGKITADEATKLIEALGASPKFVISKEKREDIEEKFHQFSKDVNKFAKEAGSKIQEFYKDVEPKLKKAGLTALEKCANTLDALAKSINESLEKHKESCDDEHCECHKDDEPKPN